MVSTTVLAAAGVSVALTLLASLFLLWKYQQERREFAEWEAKLDGLDGDFLEGVDVRSSTWGLIKTWRRRKKAKKMAKKGYVKWFLLGSGLEGPHWVKPERDGTGVAKHRRDGEPYLFPEDDMVIDKSTGAYVALHHKGEATPVPIKHPELPQMDADRLREVTDLTAESDPPGWLSTLDMDTGTLMMIGIGALFIVFAAMRMM